MVILLSVVLGALLLLAGVILLVCLVTAPTGTEDAEGFHAEPPAKPSCPAVVTERVSSESAP